MIHWVGIVLATAGATCSLTEWKFLPKSVGDRVRQLAEGPSAREDSLPAKTFGRRRGPFRPRLMPNTTQQLELDETPRKDRDQDPKVVRRLVASSGCVALSMGTYIGAPWLLPVAFFGTGIMSAPILSEGWRAVYEEKRLRVDFLDSSIISLCLLFGKVGPAAFMVWILDLADLLLDRTTRKSKRFIADAFGQQVRTAWKLVDGVEIQVAVKELVRGDRIIVRTGDQVPVDGLVTEGSAMIDQHRLTGESAPAEKVEEDIVYAMTVVVAGQLQVEVTETGVSTLAGKSIQIITDAAEHKVRMQSIGERTADQMVVPTLGLGYAGYMMHGTGAMLATLNADYGTGIRVAAPIALLASLGNAARNGVLIKDSKVLELLPKIDVVVFDKTGTLTHEVPQVANIVVDAETTVTAEDVLLYTAAAEQKLSHPIATAILGEAERLGLELPDIEDSNYSVGFGIEAVIGAKRIRVGSARYFEREGMTLSPPLQEALEIVRAEGHTAILASIGDEVVGLIELRSAPRDEAVGVVELLKERGISELVLISGDHDAPTRALAQRLGIPRYEAGVLPHEKADHVRAFQRAGKKVLMVGDGINDAAALSLADVSISIKGASTVAVDVADVVFMDGTLKRFNILFGISERLTKNVRRSFMMIAIPNTICILGAMSGFFGLASSLVLNNGFNLMAAVNGLAPLRARGSKGLEPIVDRGAGRN